MAITVNGVEITDEMIENELPRHADADNPLKRAVHEVVLRQLLLQQAAKLGFAHPDDNDDARIDRVIAAEVHAAVEAVKGTNALLFINDHWQVALAAGAYGVHLGQEDLDALQPHEVATLRASGVRLGVSTHGYAEMLRAAAVWPSYIAMGAVFPTTLKRMETAPQGVARLGLYAKLMQQFPLVAIGGIGAEQFAEVAATGVGSLAVVRALVNAPDPEAAAAQLMQALAAAQHGLTGAA